ncbi:cation:H+ antiporter [Haladaptatus litoreus]|uniref:Cation:H+ antiporter n=1 Tax=Haladaptatus litoreus TaxID=553468 RepID=A0A1N6W635_9EURY|nr:sodium:calcium antiporter [Haladaptatus litoreus]SIQ85591.1 cation:H+ antiporter [Haladaptatus litoreus]
MSSLLRHPLTALIGAVLLTLAWVGVWTTGAQHTLGTLVVVAVSGLAILGASFLLAWGAETAEKDVPRAFALAVLAILAVAPEYAVDAYFAWTAGANAGTEAGREAANLAVANMTGANRILIGLGWSGIALFSIHKARQHDGARLIERNVQFGDSIPLDRDIATEILFLFCATVYAFFVPFGGGIDGVDTIVLVSLYAIYIAIIIQGEVGAEEHVGVPAYFQRRPRSVRIPIVFVLFFYSGFLIFTAVEPFAHGLETLGVQFGIPPFFMLQWVAPLASESPELIVTAYLVNKARSTAAFNALISSKLNQWTLLIGTLVVVYSISLGQYGVLPFDRKQAAEIWLTAAQSLFAISVLINFQISVREAVTILVLFSSQVVAEFVLLQTLPPAQAATYSYWLLIAYSICYVVLALALFWKRHAALREVLRLTAAKVRRARVRGAEESQD